MLAEGRGIECVVTGGIMIASPARSMFVDDAEPERTLTKSPTWGSWGVCGEIDDAGEVEVECDDAGVSGVGEYEIEWDAMAGCVGLGGDVRGPNTGKEVEMGWGWSAGRWRATAAAE